MRTTRTGHTPRGRGRPGPLAAVAALVAVLLAAVALAGSAAGATPATLRLLSDDPSLGTRVTVTAPGGETFRADPGAYTVRVTPTGAAATEHQAWCIDRTRAISIGRDYEVTVLTPADDPSLDSAAYREAAWLALRAPALIAAAGDPGDEAAAIQVAVWQLTGQAADIPAVTSATALNTRVAALRDLARGRRPAQDVALQMPAALTAGVPATVTVTGTPGAEVALTAEGGTLSAGSVVLDAGGRAAVDLTAAAGTVTVTARADGGRVLRVAHLPGRRAPQDVLVVVPQPLAATATAAAAAPVPVTPAPAPAPAPAVTPTVTPTPVPAVTPVPVPAGRAAAVPGRIGLVKGAPTGTTVGRTIVYTLTVRNTGTVTARRVVIRDPLPAGTVLVRRPRGVLISRGVLIHRVGDLAPGATRTIRVRVRVTADSPARLVNRAAASARNARTVHARAVTRVARALPAVQPPVTG